MITTELSRSSPFPAPWILSSACISPDSVLGSSSTPSSACLDVQGYETPLSLVVGPGIPDSAPALPTSQTALSLPRAVSGHFPEIQHLPGLGVRYVWSNSLHSVSQVAGRTWTHNSRYIFCGLKSQAGSEDGQQTEQFTQLKDQHPHVLAMRSVSVLIHCLRCLFQLH